MTRTPVAMSDNAEQQAEEIEVLKSIYEGDENFKQINPTTYQYKYTDGDKSFILEVSWGPSYPAEKPTFNLDVFYNQHLLPDVKEMILMAVNSEADQWLGCAMTYTLFEGLKEKVPEILSQQTEEMVVPDRIEKNTNDDQDEETTTVITVGNEEDGNAEVTYFMDEDGRYYYQSADSQNLIAMSTEPTDETDEISHDGESETQENTEHYQTVTLVPSESGGEMNYVLVVQEEAKPAVNMNIKVEEQNGEQDIYTFEDEDVRDEADQSADEKIQTTHKAYTKLTKAKSKGVSKYKCTFCSYTSPRRYLLLRHMKSHSENRPYKCSVCERGFKTVLSLQNHVNMHNGVKPHACKYCGTAFTTSGELVRHVRYRHTHEKPHRCGECDYASVELSKLRRHIRCHTGERPYQCPHCTYASPDTFKLKRHLRTHTGEKPYKCDLCNHCFTQSNSLKAHKLIHNISQKPVFKCQLCPAKCSRKADLRIHIQKLHTAIKPLKCKRCGKSFPDRYSYKVHNKTHEGEKCFKCQICPYASTTLRHLNSHMYKHTDERPFRCDKCHLAFRQKQLLKRHQNLYHDPNYVPKPPKEKTHCCNECNRSFAHKGNLIRHLAVHDPDSGYHEKALALKMGRLKKVKVEDFTQKLNGRQSSQLMNEDSDNDPADLVRLGVTNDNLKEGAVMTVADDDGSDQQYVVIEVIQLEDGTAQQVAVVAPKSDMQSNDQDDDDEEDYVVYNPGHSNKKEINTIKIEKDVDSCFGFDDEEAEDEEEEYDNDVVLQLV